MIRVSLSLQCVIYITHICFEWQTSKVYQRRLKLLQLNWTARQLEWTETVWRCQIISLSYVNLQWQLRVYLVILSRALTADIAIHKHTYRNRHRYRRHTWSRVRVVIIAPKPPYRNLCSFYIRKRVSYCLKYAIKYFKICVITVHRCCAW